jgi:hypothetical protein
VQDAGLLTLEDVLLNLASYWKILIPSMILITGVSWIVVRSLRRSGRSKAASHFMAGPVFLTCIPGIFFCIVLGYLLLFTSRNLLTVPLFYFFPPLWMIASLWIFSKMIDFNQVPGFHRLSGLMVFSAVSFLAIFMLYRFRVLAIVWINPLWAIGIVFIAYLIWKRAMDRMRGKR